MKKSVVVSGLDFFENEEPDFSILESDIYDEDSRDRELEGDALDAAEVGFMQGYDQSYEDGEV